MKTLNQILGVKQTTSHAIVFLETSHLSYYYHCRCKMIGFWARMVDEKSERSRTMFKIYQQQRLEGDQDKWTGKIKSLLLSHGFANYWNADRVPSSKTFMREFKRNAAHLERATLLQGLESSKGRYFKEMSESYAGQGRLPLYFKLFDSNLSTHIVRAKLFSHHLKAETGSWSQHPLSVGDCVCSHYVNLSVGENPVGRGWGFSHYTIGPHLIYSSKAWIRLLISNPISRPSYLITF